MIRLVGGVVYTTGEKGELCLSSRKGARDEDGQKYVASYVCAGGCCCHVVFHAVYAGFLFVMTDPWDEGFDAGMADVHEMPCFVRAGARKDWCMGFYAATGYRHAIRTRPAEPRDTKAAKLKEYLERTAP